MKTVFVQNFLLLPKAAEYFLHNFMKPPGFSHNPLGQEIIDEIDVPLFRLPGFYYGSVANFEPGCR